MDLEALDQSPQVPSRPEHLRQCTILVGDNYNPDPDYPVGVLEIESGEDTVLIAIAAVAEVDHRVVVALPFESWHRTLARRKIPSTFLTKAVSVTVPFAERESDAEDSGVPQKVWLAYLSAEAEEYVLFDSSTETTAPDILFSKGSPTCLPSAVGLAQALEQHFAFETARSGADPPTERVSPEERLDRLEALVQSLAERIVPTQSSVAASTAAGATAKAASRPSALRQPKCREEVEAEQQGGFSLDVLRSARQAGVPDSQISELLRVAGQGKSKMTDFPAAPAKPVVKSRNPLSESEEEEAEVAEAEEQAANQASSDPMVQAVTKLTQIASRLASQRKQAKSLDALLDVVGSGGASESSSSVTTKNATAYRALKKALTKQPAAIYASIEKLMAEDFQVRNHSVPGSSPVLVTSRAWLELRSRVQGYQTPVRYLWGIAGAHDALVAGAPEEARARLALLLAMGDQHSIDRGNWMVAAELSLEEGPPMASFNGHTLPTEAEPPFSKLVDPRWMDLVLHRLASYDTLNEKKKKLTYRKPPGLTSEADALPKPKPGPKKEPRPKKGAGKEGESGGAGPEPPGLTHQ